MAEPALQKRFGKLFETRDERIGSRLGGVVFGGPGLGRGDEAFDNRAVADLEQLVVFRHGTRSDGMLALHLASDFKEFTSLHPQAEARQPSEQLLQRILANTN